MHIPIFGPKRNEVSYALRIQSNEGLHVLYTCIYYCYESEGKKITLGYTCDSDENIYVLLFSKFNT